jgi:hypothetical protein
MRTLVTLSALALFGLVQPAAAQMCSPGQQAQASTPSQGSGGMMCGMMGQRAATDPMAETRSPSQQSAQGGGCPCCRNMAMMQGGGMRGMMGGGMGGMQMPSQPSTPQGTPGAGETPQTPRPPQ